MDPNSYDVNKNPQSYYGALTGSVCFPMPVMYNPMNSYPFVPPTFFHPMLSSHGLQDSHLLSNSDVLNNNQLVKADTDMQTRTLAYLQRYQTMSKSFLSPTKKSMSKYCITPPSLMNMHNDYAKLSGSVYGIQNSGDSNGSGIMPSLTSATSPTSAGGYTDKESYLSSPSTEVEEPDSSGKCSTDVVEQKVVPRFTCDSSQPPACPICEKTMPLQDLNDHYHVELNKIDDIIRKKEWLSQEENSDQLNSLRIQSYHDVEKKCPEFRKETYLRVKANRINRLGGTFRLRSKRQCIEEVKQPWKTQRLNPLCSPKQEHIEETSTQSSHQSMLMLELTGNSYYSNQEAQEPLTNVQQLNHRTEERTEVSTESYISENRNISHYPGQLQSSGEGYHEDQKKTDMADSSCNGFNNLDVDTKCQVCLESFKIPVVSVCCWHVHCETCWLKSLGHKRVCPRSRCDTITSPADLRKVFM
ncbi:e3 ubiquitin-protein ligase RNF220 [Caerostris extrusa]|uniref:E3 ubiquitin-protein ligase RNF220 n=1 Tax=Caerostris extrusa TaxID=172846 RepID=A0AAV4VHD4_CAEEX|nr:e3 ubiquitin-protein ligase RNF220 [Caerostris extrusa]